MRKIQIKAENGELVQELKLDRSRKIILLGRNLSNDLVIDDSHISPAHLELNIERENITLRDLGTNSGTEINGKILSPHSRSTWVKADKIIIGGHYSLEICDVEEKTGTDSFPEEKIGEIVRNQETFFRGHLNTLTTRLKGIVGAHKVELMHSLNSFGETITQQIKELAAIQEMGLRMNEIYDFEELLDTVMGMALEVSSAERGFFMLLSEEKGDLEILVGKGVETLEEKFRKASQSIAELAYRRNEVVIMSSSEKNPEYIKIMAGVPDSPKSVLVAPLHIRGEVAGVLYLDNRFVDRCFGEKNLDFIKAFAAQASVCLYNARLLNQGVTDGLTELYNNRFFRQRLSEEIRRAGRHDKLVSLILFDVDDFKAFGEKHGNQAGDLALRTISKILKSTIRISDVAARFGADEFALILTETDEKGANLLAERLRERIQSHQINFDEKTFTVSCSFGVAVLSGKDQGREDLIRFAESGIRKARQEGGNRVTTFVSPDPA